MRDAASEPGAGRRRRPAAVKAASSGSTSKPMTAPPGPTACAASSASPPRPRVQSRTRSPPRRPAARTSGSTSPLRAEEQHQAGIARAGRGLERLAPEIDAARARDRAERGREAAGEDALADVQLGAGEVHLAGPRLREQVGAEGDAGFGAVPHQLD